MVEERVREAVEAALEVCSGLRNGRFNPNIRTEEASSDQKRDDEEPLDDESKEERREAEKTPLNFENLTRITLNADDPYPKICLPCKIKLESAIGFKHLCVTSREAQEVKLSHLKRGRSCEAESNSPSAKRMPSAASDDGGSKCNPVARKLVSRYRQILPDPTVEKKSLEGGGSSSEESHLLTNVGVRNPKLSLCRLSRGNRSSRREENLVRR